ncbi:hypothetical protein V6N13_066465 [Hibiscus sabdariffa]|uniref:Uncharacterized protein n=1 Tax=Hibiscus sabdariffa TaxID=183260 RepID=A0ABR2DQI3_9ROSI
MSKYQRGNLVLKCDRGWDIYGRLRYSWIWVQNFKQSSYHAMLLLLFTAGGSGVPQCCIILIYVGLLYFYNFDESLIWSNADWSCSTYVGLFCC